MTPSELYDKISEYLGTCDKIICDIHSACSPDKGKKYMCVTPASDTHVIDFDKVKEKADKEKGMESRKSVDAVKDSSSGCYFCFIELKSWQLLISHNGNKDKIEKQAAKYASDLPIKFMHSMEICREICSDENALDGCKIIYILVSDTSPEKDGLADINASLTALAGTSSNLNILCDKLSSDIMKGIPNVETRYWKCREFDSDFASL